MTKRYWYVVVDDTPVDPSNPLSSPDEAVLDWLGFVAEDADQCVEIRQCDDADLDWAFGEGERP